MKLTDADFCESHCPVCTNARKGNKIAAILQRGWLTHSSGHKL